jgi:hypothetical protein
MSEASANQTNKRAGGRERGLIWKYFDDIEGSRKVSCNVELKSGKSCGARYEKNSPTSMEYHLQTVRKSIFDDFLKEKAAFDANRSAKKAKLDDSQTSGFKYIRKINKR